MQIKLNANPNGTFSIVRTDDNGGLSQWDMSARQVARHLRGIANPQHPFNGLSAGDKSAAQDIAAAAAQIPAADPQP